MADGPTALELVIQGTQTAAIIVAAGAATWGFNTWRAQMAGKRKFELAEDALTAFYEFEGVIKFVRSPWTKSNEGKDRPEREGESEGVARIRDSYFAPMQRLSNREELFARIRTLRLKFRTYFGEEAEDAFQTAHTIPNEIMIAVHMLIDSVDDPEILTSDPMYQEWKSTIWQHNNEDEIQQRINDAIELIETLCKPILIK